MTGCIIFVTLTIALASWRVRNIYHRLESLTILNTKVDIRAIVSGNRARLLAGAHYLLLFQSRSPPGRCVIFITRLEPLAILNTNVDIRAIMLENRARLLAGA